MKLERPANKLFSFQTERQMFNAGCMGLATNVDLTLWSIPDFLVMN